MFKNFSYLAIHQFFKLLIPLLLIPYFIKIVGADNWGKIVYVQYFYSFFIVFISYGFDVYGVKLIADSRDNLEKLSKIVSTIFTLKIILFCCSLLIILGSIIIFQKLAALSIILLYSVGLLFFQVFNSIWIFQGLEKMKYIPIITFIESTINLAFVFLLVRGAEDYLLIPLIQSGTAVIAGLLSLIFVLKFTKISLKIVTLEQLLKAAKNGLQFFLSRICNVITDKSPILIIGLFLPYNYVTFFDLSLKIIQGLIIPFGILSEVVYPRISQSKNLKQANQVLLFAFLSSTLLYLILYNTCDILMYAIGGNEFLGFKTLFLILGLRIPIEGVSYILGTSFLVSFGFKKTFNLSVIYGIPIYFLVLLSIIFTQLTGGVVFAILLVLTSFVVFFIRLIFSLRYNLIRFQW